MNYTVIKRGSIDQLYTFMRHCLNRLIKKVSESKENDETIYAFAAVGISDISTLFKSEHEVVMSGYLNSTTSASSACVFIDSGLQNIKVKLSLRYKDAYPREVLLHDLDTLIKILDSQNYYQDLPKMFATIHIEGNLFESREDYSALIDIAYRSLCGYSMNLHLTPEEYSFYFSKDQKPADFIHPETAVSHKFLMEKLFLNQSETLKRNIEKDRIFAIAYEETRKLYTQARAKKFLTGVEIDIV